MVEPLNEVAPEEDFLLEMLGLDFDDDPLLQCNAKEDVKGGDSFSPPPAITAAREPQGDAPRPPSMEDHALQDKQPFANNEKASSLLLGSPGAMCLDIIQAPPMIICKENAQLAEFAIVLKYSNVFSLKTLRLVVTERETQLGIWQDITFYRRAQSKSFQMRSKMNSRIKSEIESSATPVISDGECIVREQDQLALVWLKANRKNRVGTYSLQFFDEEIPASEALEIEIKSKPNVKYGKAFGGNKPPSKKDNEKIFKTVQDKYVHELCALKNSFNNENCPQVSYFDPSTLGDIFDRNKSMHRLTPSIRSEPSTTSRVSYSLNQLQLFPKRAREDEDQTAEGVFKKFKALVPAERTRFEEMFSAHMGKCNATPGSNAILNRSAKRKPRRGRK